MALSIIVTKKSVTLSQEGLYQITLNLQYLDGSTVLIDRDFSENYWTGQTPAFVVGKFKEKMQKAIDDYKAAQIIYNSAALDTAITTLKNGLGV
jgi:hypothetical protein